MFVSSVLSDIPSPPRLGIGDVLTYVGGAFGDGQVGAHAPGPAVVVLLAAAAVGARGVVLALAAQLPLVEHAAVGMQVALAPETHKTMTDT